MSSPGEYYDWCRQRAAEAWQKREQARAAYAADPNEATLRALRKAEEAYDSAADTGD